MKWRFGCPRCGGQMYYDGDWYCLQCGYCGATRLEPIERMGEYVEVYCPNCEQTRLIIKGGNRHDGDVISCQSCASKRREDELSAQKFKARFAVSRR